MVTDIDGEPLERFMLRRHQIYLKRAEGKPGPWSRDPIFQRYKFTNIYRELDRETVWLRKNWREPYAGHPFLWFAMAFARQVNWSPTLDMVGFPDVTTAKEAMGWLEDALELMQEEAREGGKVYTGAYMLRCDIQDATTPDKPTYTCRKVMRPLLERCDGSPSLLALDGVGFFAAMEMRAPANRSVQEVHQWFMQHHGWGGFLSYEVVTDLMETRYLRDAVDRDTWAFAGPGAVRGLNRLLGRDYKASMKPNDALYYMTQLLAQLRWNWPKGWPILRLREVEHSLCEFDKYERVRLRQGAPRSRFTPQRELP